MPCEAGLDDARLLNREWAHTGGGKRSGREDLML